MDEGSTTPRRVDTDRDHGWAHAQANWTGVQSRVLRGGVRVSVALTGGPALVLLRGLTDSWRSFQEVIAWLPTAIPARVWQAATRGFLEADHAAGLTSITAPTVLLWGDRDELALRSDQDALCAAIPGARLLIRPGTGHALHWEQPEWFAAVCADVVERCFTGNGV